MDPLLFGALFFGLRQAGIKIGLGDWMGVLRALQDGLIAPDLKDFYFVARALLIKNESQFDVWDQVFGSVFGGLEPLRADVEKLLDWLKNAQALRHLSPEQLAALEALPLDELRRRFAERVAEQKERHDGGSRWVGTGGTSPFGHGGANPGGVRVGGGGGGRSAVQVADERRYRDYRSDLALDDRQMAIALKRLRKLSRREQPLELDLDETIDKTCRNAGELELEFRPPRKNQARVVLMMDTGGSMDPFADLVERLFSAASQLNHWKKFEAFAFHNCVYERVYRNIATDRGVLTAEILRDRPADTFLIFVGDAYMAPYELVEAYGAIALAHENPSPGIVWLHRLRTQFPYSVWLNPMPKQTWQNGWTIQMIGSLFPMFPLTLAGLDDAVTHLVRGTPLPVPELDPRLTRR